MELLSGFFSYVLPFLIVLSVVVFVHEYGHYYVARWNGVRVEAFSIGFGRELFGWHDKHGTRWKFCLIPLGGYVKMLGDADAASATVDAEAAKLEESFPAKTVGQRAAIVFAGPGANFLFSILVYAIVFTTFGKPYTASIVADVREGSPAEVAGLLPGDHILAVDGEEIESFQDLQLIVRDQAEVALTFEIKRGDEIFDLVVTPQLDVITDRLGTEHKVGLVGISSSAIEFRQSNPFNAVGQGISQTWSIITGSLSGVGEMIVGRRGAEELGGPLRIAQMSGEFAQDGWLSVVQLIAFLSVSLGLINLFPIPMLDGGHLLFYAIEAVRGRPLTERSQEIAFRIGLAMVMSLMIFATWNDLVHLDVIQSLTGIFS